MATAAQLADSIGVDIHISYSDTSYGDAARMVSLLTQLGVRHVRDGVKIGLPYQDTVLRRLAAAHIGALLIAGNPENRYQAGTPAQTVAWVKAQGPGVPEALEGANEWDCSGSADWVGALRSYEKQAYAAFAASLPTLTRVGPSFCRQGHPGKFGPVDGADATNAHVYAGVLPPESAVAPVVADARNAGPGLPVWVTESGYVTDVAEQRRPGAISEPAAATYAVRTILEDARLGVPRTYLYELLDEKPDPAGDLPQRHYGLVRYDGTPKPSFVAVQHLLQLLHSFETGNAATSAAVSVHGNVRSLSLATGTHTRLVFLWTIGAVWDPTRHEDAQPPKTMAHLSSVEGTHWLELGLVGPAPLQPVTLATSESVDVAVGAEPIAVEAN